MSKDIKVLIADDHPALRLGIAALIDDETDMSVIAQAENAKRAVALYRENKPDVVIMDLQLPDMDGEQAISQILAEDPHAKIIVLTTYGGEDTVKRTINAGARGFMLKDAASSRIIDGIRHVFNGNRLLEGNIAELYADAMQQTDLTEREMEILRTIAQGNSNKVIAYKLNISEATVKNHVANILQKLEAKDRTDAIMISLQRGMIRLQ
ncbi:response regulator [Ningiella sp. W23]|uniref:response regulator n=1 Tax=Ningiella sp. W23 TaxID=3023715 RepID=UPI0037570A2B